MKSKIKHQVVFNLKDGESIDAFVSEAKRAFAPISFAENVMQCRQTSSMCPFKYLFSFDFASEEDYENYNNHPSHIAFVENYWKTKVKDFMEIDCEEF